MKTKITLFFLTFFTICNYSYSQTSEHLVFKGVPLDGTLKEYVSKMVQDGFTNLGIEDGTAILNGDSQATKTVM